MQRKCNEKRSRVGEVGNEGKVGESQFICSSSNLASYIQILFIFKKFIFFTAPSVFEIFNTIWWFDWLCITMISQKRVHFMEHYFWNIQSEKLERRNSKTYQTEVTSIGKLWKQKTSNCISFITTFVSKTFTIEYHNKISSIYWQHLPAEIHYQNFFR